MSLTRDQLLAPRPLATERVEIPDLGDGVFVRVMTGQERDQYEFDLVQHRDTMDNARARLLVRCLCDEQGNLLLQPGDVEALGRQPATILDRASKVASRINRLNDAAIREQQGNSGPTPGAAQS